MQDFTFYSSSISELEEHYNALRIYRLLQKLVEAGHLVTVRAANGCK